MQFHRVQHPSAPLHRPGSRYQTHCSSMARGHDDDVSARLRRKLNVNPDVDPHSTTLASLPVSTARRGFGKKQPTCWGELARLAGDDPGDIERLREHMQTVSPGEAPFVHWLQHTWPA